MLVLLSKQIVKHLELFLRFQTFGCFTCFKLREKIFCFIPVYSTTDFSDIPTGNQVFHIPIGNWKKGYCVTKSGKEIPYKKTKSYHGRMVEWNTCKMICNKERNAKGCEFNQVTLNGLGWCASFSIKVKPSKKIIEYHDRNLFINQSCLRLKKKMRGKQEEYGVAVLVGQIPPIIPVFYNFCDQK